MLQRLKRQVELVEEYAAELMNETSYRGVERLEQLIIQSLLDLAVMALAAVGHRAEGYVKAAERPASAGLLDKEDASLLRAMAGLRNILVHGYASVDRDRVLQFAKTLGEDARRIAYKIFSAVERRGVDPPEVDKIREVLKGRVRLAVLFGGRAKGYSLKGDVDIAVALEEGCDLYKLGELAADLYEALGREDVDLVCLNEAPPRLVIEALGGVLIIDDPVLRAEMLSKAVSELEDVEAALRNLRRGRLDEA